MKICVTATSPNLDAQIDPRFGRCQYFVIVDPDTMEFEAISNESAAAMGGAGIQAAQTVADKGVEAVITGNVGPNAFRTLSAASIKIFTGASGTVQDAIQSYKNGELQEPTDATASAHSGMGAGMGGGGMGGGRGMGMGRGMGVAQPTAPQPAPSSSEDVQQLSNQVKKLEEQMDQIKKMIEELRK